MRYTRHGESDMTKYEGCFTALITPFRDGGIDFPALAALVDWQIESGVDGLVAVGTTGESATLTPEEHIAVIAAVVKAARGRVPVIAGAGANATAEALELTKRSEEVGADGVLQVTPYYNRPTQEGLYRHFEAISRASKLPIILYNVPSRTGCDLLPDTVERLAAFPNIVSIKEATGNMARAAELVARVGDRISVVAGDDATVLPL
jgi:4-hydroxy-tetrahydrodipicolinate synthase